MIVIKIAKDFSDEPGARYKKDGPNSGEEFRETHLIPLFAEESDENITIDLDDTEGYATSFLEEAFGGLARIYSIEKVLKRIKFISKQEPSLPDEIIQYINECND